MSSIINAATSGGLISSGDTSGILKLQTASTDAVTITAAQNVGIGTSSPAAFGAGFHAAPPFIREKWDKYKSRASDVVTTEMDVATNQLASSRAVDVTPIEKVIDGDIAAKPIAERAIAAEKIVRYTETPEFKIKFEGSKAVDEAGAPLMVYHGTGRDFDVISTAGEGKSKGAGAFFSADADVASTYSPRDGGNVRPAYIKMQNPFVVEMNGQNWSKIDGKTTVIANGKPARLDNYINEFSVTSDKLSRWAKDSGYDGVVFKSASDRGPYFNQSGVTQTSDVYNVFSPEQIISAYGADDLDAITARLDADNKAAAANYIESTVNPDNDTAIDSRVIAELEAYEEQLALKKDEAALDEYNAYLKEVAAMKRQGLLSEADEIDMLDAINSVNEKDINKAYEALQICLTRG